MDEKKVLELFKKEKALLTGHFLLSSGLHSPNYLQCAILFQKPWIAEILCEALVKKLGKIKVDTVLGPALGGILVAHEMARALKVRSIFAERVDGGLTLRRGFSLKKNEKVLVVEDVVTTGKSTFEVIDIVKQCDAKVVGIASIVDRSGGSAIFEEALCALLKIEVKTYRPEGCPMCREGKLALAKPGSREQKSTGIKI